MIKIERVKESFYRDSYFSFHPEEFYDCAAFRLTLFGKSFRIKYSKKFNYFLIARKTICAERNNTLQSLLLGSLAQIVVEQTLQKEGISISNLEALVTDGRSPVFTFKGQCENSLVFIKCHIHATPPSQASKPAFLRSEYENGLLFSSGCPYFLKPLKYFALPHFELLVTPFIENAQTLHDVMRSTKGCNQKHLVQLSEVRTYMKEHNLAHGDLHGNNLLIGTVGGGEEQLYIIDFAVARHIEGDKFFSSWEYKSDERNFNRFLK